MRSRGSLTPRRLRDATDEFRGGRTFHTYDPAAGPLDRHGPPPTRAARSLLPDARQLRGGGGSRAGDVPARLAGPSRLHRRRGGAGLAVQDRHERLPGRAAGALAAARELVRRPPVPAAV